MDLPREVRNRKPSVCLCQRFVVYGALIDVPLSVSQLKVFICSRVNPERIIFTAANEYSNADLVTLAFTQVNTCDEKLCDPFQILWCCLQVGPRIPFVSGNILMPGI